MATKDLTAGAAGIPINSLGKIYRLKNTIDFSIAANNSLAADVIQCLDIQANTQVVQVWTKVVTPEGGVCTADVGDGTDPNGYNDAMDLNAAAGTIEQSADGTDAYADDVQPPGGKIYTAADTIDMVLDHNTDAAVIEIYAFCIDLN